MLHSNRKGVKKTFLEVNEPRSQPHQVNFESCVSLAKETECVCSVEAMRSCELVKAEFYFYNSSQQ